MSLILFTSFQNNRNHIEIYSGILTQHLTIFQTVVYCRNNKSGDCLKIYFVLLYIVHVFTRVCKIVHEQRGAIGPCHDFLAPDGYFLPETTRSINFTWNTGSVFARLKHTVIVPSRLFIVFTNRICARNALRFFMIAPSWLHESSMKFTRSVKIVVSDRNLFRTLLMAEKWYRDTVKKTLVLKVGVTM